MSVSSADTHLLICESVCNRPAVKYWCHHTVLLSNAAQVQHVSNVVARGRRECGKHTCQLLRLNNSTTDSALNFHKS